MKLIKEKLGLKLLVKTDGRIDTMTAGQWGTEINDDLDDIRELVLEFSQVDYVSSVGLRAILELQKRMKHQGSMTLLNVQTEVMDVFEMTGFVKILNIEN